MKLVFSKNKELEVSVHKKSGDSRSDFSYIDMIKGLIKTKKLDDPDLDGEFSDAEKGSINSMVKHINVEIASFYSDEDEEG